MTRVAGWSVWLLVWMVGLWFIPSSVQAAPLKGVTLKASPVSQQTVNTPVNLTATANGGKNVTYQFSVRYYSIRWHPWTQLTNATVIKTCTWTPKNVGNYELRVVAREGSSKKYSAIIGYKALSSNPPPSSLTLSISPASPQPVAKSLTLTAQGGNTGQKEYQFWVGVHTGTSVTWTPLQTGYIQATQLQIRARQAGLYSFKVIARPVGTTGGKQTSPIVDFTVRALRGDETSDVLRIAQFSGDKAAAVSYTFDDGLLGQAVNAVPMFNALGLHATFYVIAGDTSDAATTYYAGWPAWKAAAAKGHEIGNHSMTHPHLPKISTSQLDYQINQSAAIIAAKTGQIPVTFAYPYNEWNTTVHNVVMQQHIAGREQETVDFEGSGFSATWANSLVDDAISTHTWIVPMIHGVGFEYPGYLPIDKLQLQSHLQYVKSRESVVWVDTYANVTRYVLERGNTEISLIAPNGNQVQFTLTSSLDPGKFNQPLTVVINTGSQKAKSASAVYNSNGKSVPIVGIVPGAILVNVLPGQGSVTVSWTY